MEEIIRPTLFQEQQIKKSEERTEGLGVQAPKQRSAEPAIA